MLNLNNIDLVNSTNNQIKLFGYSFFIWVSIFAVVNQKLKLKNQTKKVRDDIKNRVVSIIHGAVTFWAATYIVLYENPTFGTPNSQAMQFAMIISASYFVYDFLACLYYDLADLSLVSHHSLAICGYAVATFTKMGAPSSIWGLMCAEVSNFPMHMRVILRQLGLRQTKLYEAFEWTYFALYIIFRGTLVPYMVWYTWPESDVPLLVKLTATGLFLQSVYFIFEMKKILMRQYYQFLERKKKNIHHYWFCVNPRVSELSYVNNQKRDKVF